MVIEVPNFLKKGQFYSLIGDPDRIGIDRTLSPCMFVMPERHDDQNDYATFASFSANYTCGIKTFFPSLYRFVTRLDGLEPAENGLHFRGKVQNSKILGEGEGLLERNFIEEYQEIVNNGAGIKGFDSVDKRVRTSFSELDKLLQQSVKIKEALDVARSKVEELVEESEEFPVVKIGFMKYFANYVKRE